MPLRTYSEEEHHQRIKWVLGGLFAAFVVGFFFGFGAGKDVSDKRVRQEGIEEGIAIGYARGKTDGIDIGKKQGEQIGRAQGGRQGYARGYEDRMRGRTNALQTIEVEELGKLRYASRINYLLAAGTAAIALMLFWLPFIYFDVDSEKRQGAWLENLRDSSKRHAFLAKGLVSIVSVVAAGVFLPSDLLARASANMFDSTSLSEAGVVVAGMTASAALITVMLWSIGAAAARLRFWLQMFWAVLFPVLLYQFVGTIAAASRVHTTFGVKMLLLQTGAFIMFALILTYVLLAPERDRLSATSRRCAGDAA